MRLAGKVAIITGAGSGIGRATAVRFAAEGAKLVIGDKSEAVHETAAMIGVDVHAMRMDAGSEGDVERLIASAIDRFGGLDIAYANAGVSGGLTGIFDHSVEEWQAILQVNLIGPFLMIKHAAPRMIERGKGSIVCTASVAGIRSGAGCPA
jgi:NAD(P)-dependent dehydrogenase (short-subunit alcohol dehydrogenase family)